MTAASNVTPIRVQRSRAKGSRLPVNTVVVSRPSRWGNPFAIGRHYKRDDGEGIPGMGSFIYMQAGEGHQDERYTTIKDRAQAVEWYRWYTTTFSPRKLAELRSELRGKNLACFCPLDQPCHAEILLELANA